MTALTIQPNIKNSSLEASIQFAQTIPLLTMEEEYQYARRLQEDGDIEAARHLVMSHLRLVIKIARDYKGYGLPQEDLIQEGNIGLMKAVKRFDPNVGVRLVSFAIHWIKAEIHEFIIRNWRIVKIATTKAQRKLFFNLRSAKKQLNRLSAEEANTIADDLGVPVKDLYEMENRLSRKDMSLSHQEYSDAPSPIDYLESNEATPEQALLIQQQSSMATNNLKQALSKLDSRVRDIIVRRWLSDKKSTLQELAEDYDISAERVRQLEQMALKKLKGSIARN